MTPELRKLCSDIRKLAKDNEIHKKFYELRTYLQENPNAENEGLLWEVLDVLRAMKEISL